MPPKTAPSQGEFIALMGTLFATLAFSIDAMLPAIPEIGAELSPASPDLGALVVTSFVLGMGLGTFFVGPISDAFGRRRVIFWGTALYIAATFWAYLAGELYTVLAARVLAGIGISAPRIVATAIIRDLYSGRVMAQVTSFVFTVFTIFPAVAPLIGEGIIALFDWRAIFLAFILFVCLPVGWLALRLPETLPPEARRRMSMRSLREGLREIFGLRQMRLSIAVQTLVFGMLFGFISSIQLVFDHTYGEADRFPRYFFAIALLAFPAAPLNGMIVTHIGMRPLIRRSLAIGLLLALVYGGIALSGLAGEAEVWVFFAWCVSVFAGVAFTIGNLNALALEPLGHVAGLASSVMAGLATVGGAVIGALITVAFDGTALPMVFAVVLLSVCALPLMQVMPREKAEG